MGRCAEATVQVSAGLADVETVALVVVDPLGVAREVAVETDAEPDASPPVVGEPGDGVPVTGAD